MKKVMALLFAILLTACACTAIENIDIPEPTKSQEAEPTPAPTATSAPPVDVPETIEELSEVAGVRVYSPQTLPEGYSLSQLGYDGENTAAVKYTAEEGTLLYTFTRGIIDAPTDAASEKVNGFTSYYVYNNRSSELQWTRGGVTYQIISEPAKDHDALLKLMTQMLKGPALLDDEKSVKCDNLEEVSKLTGFDVKEPSYIPDGFKLSTISCYRLYSASLKYISESDTLTLRICEGDIPPAYNKKKYKDPKTENIGGTDVELYYGDGGRIALAQWTSGGYSHQIYSESGASLNSIKLMVVGFSR